MPKLITCIKCHKKMSSQEELDTHFEKIHANTDKMNKNRQGFLLSFSPDISGYKEIQVNGYWLIRSYNAVSKSWQVAIYTNDAYQKYKAFSRDRAEE